MLTTGNTANLTLEGIRKLVGDSFKRYPLQFKEWMNVNKADKRTVFDQEVVGIGSLAVKSENAPISIFTPRVGRQRSYTAATFAGGIAASWESEQDDLYGFIRRHLNTLGLAMNETMNIEAAGLFNRSDSLDASPITGFDGLALLHAAHTNLDGTDSLTYKSNRLAADLSESILQTALIQFERIQDASDNRVMVGRPQKIVTTPENMFLLDEIMGSEKKPFTPDNTKNVLRNSLTPVILNYAVEIGNDRWLVLAQEHDLNFFMRTAPVTDSYDDKSTLAMVNTIAGRFTIGFGDWRPVIGSAGV